MGGGKNFINIKEVGEVINEAFAAIERVEEVVDEDLMVWVQEIMAEHDEEHDGVLYNFCSDILYIGEYLMQVGESFISMKDVP